MTVIQLECFMEVYKQRNFSKAAANLYLSQPTLSRHIQTLEEELRAPLFIRASNTIHLTAIGQALYPTLEQLYRSFREASAEMSQIVDRHLGLLRIGVSATLQIRDECRWAIQQTREKYPNAKIQVCHLSMSQIHSSLMSGSVDILLALDAFVPPSDKVYHYHFPQEQMFLAVPAEHPNAEMETIEQARIKDFFPDLDFYLLDAAEFDTALQEDLKSSHNDYDNNIDIVKIPSSSYDMEDIMLMVRAGLGVTCINEHSVLRGSPRVRMIPLVDVTPTGVERKMVTIGAYWNDKNNNPILRSFVKDLKRSER